MNPAQAQERLAAAMALHREGKLSEASEGYRSLLDGPCALDALINLGAALHDAGQPTKALPHYAQALSLSPDHPLALFNQGNSLMKLGSFSEAAASFRRALLVDPALMEARLALGTALQGDGELSQAIALFREALTLEPAHAEAHWYLALALLSAGELSEGWQEYEWRWQKKSFTSPRRPFPEPLWDGSPLNGRRILIHAEQGLGDTIHFIRYAPLVAAAGGTVIAECQSAALKPLISRVFGITEVVVLGDPLPPFEVQIPLLSLPRVFGTTLASVPSEVPYLSADPQRLFRWRGRIGTAPRFKVGIVWAGKPFPDPFRSSTLSDLAPLAALPEVSFYSLQLGEGALHGAALDLIDYTGEIRDFGDTAALISLLDLVISVDTSVAHLAGALGKPVFLMLPKGCDWRWLRGRDDSPWYPTMRLFRQKEQGKWREPVNEIVGELKKEIRHYLEERADREPLNGDRAYACGVFLTEEGRYPEASLRFHKAALLQPGAWEPRFSLGVALQRMGRLGEAEEAFREGLAVADVAPLRDALGIVLQMQGDLQGARDSYRRALALDPAALRTRYNLGTVCRELGLFAEAFEAFEEVVRRAPDHADARWNRAMLLLVHGELLPGWREFHWRFRKSSAPVPERGFAVPRWDGAPVAGRTVLLYAEQGLGDTLQFVRYAPLVARLGATVLIEVQSRTLLPLLERLPGVARVLVAGEPLPRFDLHASLMELPGIFGTDLDSVPAAPYLEADPSLKELWRSRIGKDQTFNVGLVWSGSPRHENDRNRSLSPEALAPLAAIPGITFYSLQLGGKKGVEERFSLPLNDLTPLIRDFSDTAAYAANLDLVITVDTSVAHLCGGLGVPVWVLVPLVPDWRWLLEREDSPWYPSMRLFRQKERGEWGDVLKRVCEALGERALPFVPAAGGGREVAQDPPLTGVPDPAELNNRASALAAEGRHLEAVACYRQAIALREELPPLHYNMANSLKMLGRLEEALAGYRRALELEPRLVQGWQNLALTLKEAKEPAEARRAAAQALSIKPDYLDALHTMGELLFDAGELAEAEDTFRRALSLDPCALSSLNSLGIVLHTLGRSQEAAHCYERALALAPRFLHALNNLGAAYRALGRVQEAADCYRRVIALDPDYADARWGLGLIHLLRGEYREGWRLYEWRFATAEPIPRKELPQPLWDGSSLAWRSILIHAEQGFGDTIQFARYGTLLAAMGAQVYLECQVPALKRLLSTIPGISGVVARGESLPSFQVHAPLMSLPHLCGTTVDTIPAQIPYLSVAAERKALWGEKVQGGGLKVGLVWAGRKTYKDDKKRSLSLSVFAPLASVPGVHLYTLQMDRAGEQAAAPPAGMELNNLTAGIRDFADTAALIANLDLVISADTAVAHLTGALGKEVWVLLPYACDWRWLTGREDSPWYPTARLFRQREAGNWGEVLERVAETLRSRSL